MVESIKTEIYRAAVKIFIARSQAKTSYVDATQEADWCVKAAFRMAEGIDNSGSERKRFVNGKQALKHYGATGERKREPYNPGVFGPFIRGESEAGEEPF